MELKQPVIVAESARLRYALPGKIRLSSYLSRVKPRTRPALIRKFLFLFICINKNELFLYSNINKMQELVQKSDHLIDTVPFGCSEKFPVILIGDGDSIPL